VQNLIAKFNGSVIYILCKQSKLKVCLTTPTLRVTYGEFIIKAGFAIF